jgi:hypothetical protein
MENPTNETPSWEEVTPTLLELIHGDNDEAAQAAMLDIRRMAKLADKAVPLAVMLSTTLDALVEHGDETTEPFVRKQFDQLSEIN